jgi:hypothetical protein
MSDSQRTSNELRMDAYYYSFGSTGVPEIDLILSAVACAGKAYHHTEMWNEECEWTPHEGNAPVDWIYNAAAKAAEALKAARAASEPKTGLERARDVVAEVVRGLGGEARVGATLALNAIAEAMIGTRASEPPLDGDERARREQLADRLSWPQPIRADLDAAADIIRSTLTKSAESP